MKVNLVVCGVARGEVEVADDSLLGYMFRMQTGDVSATAVVSRGLAAMQEDISAIDGVTASVEMRQSASS